MAIRLTETSNQYLTIASATGVNPSGPYTIGFWIYFNSFSGNNAVVSISNDLGEWSELLIREFTLEFSVGDGNGSDTVTGTTSLSAGVWYYIAVVRSGSSSIDCYIDGVFEISSSYDTASWSLGTLQYRKIGRDSADRFVLDGRVWGFKVWNAALDMAELKRESRANQPVKKAAYWYPFLSTSTLKDFAGSQADLSAPNGYSSEDPPPVAFKPTRAVQVFPAIIYPADFSTSVRNAWLDSVESSIGSSPVLEIRTGTQPADCAASDTGTLLVSVTLPSDWMSNASAGSKSKSGTWSASASATGTAGHFRIKKSGTCHIQGSISTAGGGGDMILDNLSIFSGQAFAVSTATISSY